MLLHPYHGVDYRFPRQLLQVFGLKVPEELHIENLHPPSGDEPVLLFHLSLDRVIELECPEAFRHTLVLTMDDGH